MRTIEDTIAAALIILAVAVGALQVLARHVHFGRVDLFWSEEFLRLLLIWMTFFGAIAIQRVNNHLTVPVIYDLLPRPIQILILHAGDIIVIAILGVLAWYGWQSAGFARGQQTVGLHVSLAVFAYAVPVSAFFMAIYTLLGLIRRLRSGVEDTPPSLEI